MKFIKLFNLALLLFLILSCNNDKVTDPILPPPEIININPLQGYIGDTITITGYNFGSSQGSSTVKFNFVKAAKFIKWSSKQIVLTVPENAVSGRVWVTVGGNYSNDMNFKVIPTIETIKIGNQIWMKKNLNVDHYRNGDVIQNVTDKAVWSNLTIGGWCYYSNVQTMDSIYGKLYNWYAVNDPRGLAPEGWHLPTDEEWVELEKTIGSKSSDGAKLKDTGTVENDNGLWKLPNTDATNEFGFTALPGGWRNLVFENKGLNGYWWTSTIGSTNPIKNAFCRSLSNNSNLIIRNEYNKMVGMSVRCIKD